MALYGAIVSAPLGHVLISLLQKVFQGRKSLKAKIMQILVSNLIVSRPATAVCGVLADPGRSPLFRTASTWPPWRSLRVRAPGTRSARLSALVSGQ
jgi:hypothetical protein